MFIIKYLFLLIIFFTLACSTENKIEEKDYSGELGYKCKANNTCNANLVCSSNNKCINESDLCKYVTCLDHGTCIIEKSTENTFAICNCDEGYVNETNFRCVLKDICSNITCSGHGTCYDDNGKARCNCKSGYTPIATNCIKEDCINKTCTELNRECGTTDDGCGNTLDCGSCSGTDTCNTNTGLCEATCVPDCNNRDCGTDGCGGSCGNCATNETCNNNSCSCNSNSHLENGNCVSNGNCYNVNCGNHEQCDEDTGNCICLTGYRLINNTCTNNSVIAGITSPINVAPTVMIGYSDFLKYAYKIVLGRDYDIGGFNTWKRKLEIGENTEAEVYNNFLASAEVSGNTTLQNKTEMIKRAYLLLFNRVAQSSDINYWLGEIRNYDGTGTGYTWYEFYHILTESTEYYSANCDTDYYSYGKPLNNTAPLLKDLFSGKAYFQAINESTAVNISVQDNAGYNMMWDIGLPIIYDNNTASYYAYNRVYNETTAKFNIITSKSTDGINFTQYGGLIFENSQNVLTLYDPHVIQDNLSCPRRFVMTFECSNVDGIGGANTCMSYTTTPNRLETWSYPKTIIKADNRNGHKSASTGISLIDSENRYLSWTIVDDSLTAGDDGDESTYVKGMLLNNFFNLEEFSTIGTILLASIANINCTGEECNNKDQTDWKKEDNKYYNLYNGANYYRCIRPGHANLDDGSSNWHIKIRRSSNAIGLYTEETNTIFDAERTDICGISYAKINEFNGELYLYVAYYPASGGNRLIRSKLLWR